MANQGFWLVKTGIGASEIQAFPSGQHPLGANWTLGSPGSAVYLGNTIADTNKWIGTAAARLGVPNPTHSPIGFGEALGLTGAAVGAVFAGAGAGAAGLGAGLFGGGATDAGVAAATGAEVNAATGAGAAAGGAAAGGAASKAIKAIKNVPPKVAAGIGAAVAGATLADKFGFLTTLEFWKGIGLVIGGVLILLIAGFELKKL